MVCWINLSPLCVALTRQSSGFMADWICVIKETTSKTICLSHPSVITQLSPSAAHHSKTTASCGERERDGEGEGGGWGGICHDASERERGKEVGRGGRETRRCKNEGWRVWVKVNEGMGVKRQSAGVMERGVKTARKRKRQMEDLCCLLLPINEPTCWCCPVVLTDCLIVTQRVLPAHTCLRSYLTRVLFSLLPLLVILSRVLLRFYKKK